MAQTARDSYWFFSAFQTHQCTCGKVILPGTVHFKKTPSKGLPEHPPVSLLPPKTLVKLVPMSFPRSATPFAASVAPLHKSVCAAMHAAFPTVDAATERVASLYLVETVCETPPRKSSYKGMTLQ